MEKAFIWDLDGTILDSYTVIVSSLQDTYKEYGIVTDREEIHRYVIMYSVSSFIKSMEEKTGMSFEKMKDRYSEISAIKKSEIRLIPNAKEALKTLRSKGARHFVYTHRGVSTESVLKSLGIYDYFEDIITSQNGVPRKPAPDAINHLIEKHHLDKETTFYVGDRAIDMECAKNAGIAGILYLPNDWYGIKTGCEKYVIKDLMEIESRIRGI